MARFQKKGSHRNCAAPWWLPPADNKSWSCSTSSSFDPSEASQASGNQKTVNPFSTAVRTIQHLFKPKSQHLPVPCKQKLTAFGCRTDREKADVRFGHLYPHCAIKNTICPLGREPRHQPRAALICAELQQASGISRGVQPLSKQATWGKLTS